MKTYTVTLQTGPHTFETVTVEAETEKAAWAMAEEKSKGLVTAIKVNPRYRAVVTVNEAYNERVSPWFDTAQAAADWAQAHGVNYDAILPAVNWQELE